MGEMSDVGSALGHEVEEDSPGEEMDYGVEDTSSPIQPRRLSLTLSSPHENRGGGVG